MGPTMPPPDGLGPPLEVGKRQPGVPSHAYRAEEEAYAMLATLPLVPFAD